MKFRTLDANEIDCRISMIKNNGLALLLYKDARCDMNILDEEVGPENWQRSHELINGNLFCNVGINVKYGSSEPPVWVFKQDVGTESYTEKEKGQASDSFKRACFNWGIGRELYTAPFIWIDKSGCSITDKNGKPSCYDRFSVEEIVFNDKKVITGLSIRNDTQKRTVYTFGNIKENAPLYEHGISTNEVAVIRSLLRKKGWDEDKFCKANKIQVLSDLTPERYVKAVKMLEEGK